MRLRPTIGLITAECFRTHTSETICGIITQAFCADCNVVILSAKNNFLGEVTKHNYHEANLYELVKSSHFDGFIYDRNFIYNDEIVRKLDRLLKQTQKPVMLLDGVEHPYFENTISHDPEAFERLIEHMITIHGHRKIYCLTGIKGLPQAEERLQAYFNVMKRHKLYYDETYYSYGDFWRDAPVMYAQRIIKGELSKPDAIVCANDIMADTLIDTLQKNGLRVPEQIAVTGFDGYLDINRSHISLTSFKKSYFQLGAEAFRRLYGIITGKKCKRIQNDSDGILIGRSCGCIPAQEYSSESTRKAMQINAVEEEFLHSDFLFSTLHTNSLKELIDVIDRNMHLIHRRKRFRMFLSESFIAQLQGEDAEKIKSKPDAYREFLHCEVGKNGLSEPDTAISADEFPAFLSNGSSYPTAYYLSALHINDEHYGIAALSFGKKPFCYRPYYTTFVSYICAALEQLLKQRKTEQMLHQLINKNQQNVENPRLYSQLSQIREEMLRKPGYDWSISEICQRVNVSRSYLQRMYKSYFGRSIFEELIHARVNEAKKLLTETNTSITKIAELCGYASYSHFANQFKAEENMTPSQYREQKQKTKVMK
ncbi:MAG: substrate-binding domain-containing protein [Oscillospiraceae bacterium]|nr:substrate-binding domain-containing protein [Oscillospiraceae bacterium]